MESNVGLNLAQLGTKVGALEDNARLILKGKKSEVIEGKNFQGFKAKLHSTSASNKKIWGSLKQALGAKYKSDIASKVIPDSTDMSKPLTAGEVRQILRSAQNLKIQMGLEENLYKELHSIAKEKGRIVEIESDLKALRAELAGVQQTLAKTLGEPEDCRTPGAGPSKGSILENQAVDLAKKSERLESEISRQEEQLSALEKKEALSLRERALACKNEMLNQWGRPASDPAVVQSMIKAGALLGQMATDFANEAKELYKSGDIETLKGLAADYEKAFGGAAKFLNEKIKPSMTRSKSSSESNALKSYMQQVTRFKMLAGNIQKGSGQDKNLEALGSRIEELAQQLRGGDPAKGIKAKMLESMEAEINRATGHEQKYLLGLIKIRITWNEFEAARQKMSDYIDKDKNNNLGAVYMDLFKLCMLQKANPTFFPVESIDANLDALPLESRLLQRKIAGQAGNITPGDAHALLNQVVKAREGIAFLAKKEGIEMSASFSFAKLSPESRDKALKLYSIEKENLSLLNARAEKSAPRITVLESGEVKAFDKGLDKLSDLAKKRLKEAFDQFEPENLKGSAKRLKGGERVDQIAYNFEQELKSNPGMRVAFGLAFKPQEGEKRDAFIETWAKKQLGKKSGSLLAGKIKTAVLRHVPSADTVTYTTKIGSGGGGAVFNAKFKDATLQGSGNTRNVVLKLDGMDEKAQTIIAEALLQSQLHENPNIPKVTGCYIRKGGIYTVVMERVEGSNLNQLFNAGTLQQGTDGDRAKIALHSLAGTINALADMHQIGLVHADLKPENIMMDQKTMESRLIDFGTSDREEELKGKVGTSRYWSPEHAALSGFSTASDIYSLGTILYRLTTGGLPEFVNKGESTIRNILIEGRNAGDFSEPCWNDPDIAPLKDLIQACWARPASARPTAGQMRQAIRGETIRAVQEGSPGLKAGELGALDVLKPDAMLRQGAQDILAGRLAG